MNILGIFKTKKNATVADVDAQLAAVANERQTIAERKEALTQIIASMYGTPDAEQAENEHARLDVRLKALAIVESNLTTERRAAEVRVILADYQKRVDDYKTTFDELQMVEQGEDGLLAVEKRYQALLTQSRRLRGVMRAQMYTLITDVSEAPADAKEAMKAIQQQFTDLPSVQDTHENAKLIQEMYDATS